MNIRAKILIPISLALVFLIGTFAYAIFYLNTVKKDMERKVETVQVINDLSTRIGLKRQQARQNTLLYRISGDERYLEKVERNTADISHLLTQLKPLNTSITGQALLDSFEKNRGDVNITRAELIKAVQGGDRQLIDKTFKTWEIKANNASAVLLDFIHYNHNSLNHLFEIYGTLIGTIFITGLVLMGLCIGLVLVFYFYLQHIITIPLQQLSHMASRISNGEKITIYPIQSQDELGTLAANLSGMSVSLKKYHQSLQEKMTRKEQELKRVKEFEAQKETFISIASHELKTPITSLKVFEHILKQAIAKNGHRQYRGYLAKIESQTNKIANLITTLLDVSIIRAGKMPLTMKWFDIEPHIQEAIDLARRVHKHAHIIHKGAIGRKIYGDEEKISQVIDNLIANAIKYSAQDGKIIVTSVEQDAQAVVSVRDFGIGIDKTYQRKIFNRFFRVTDSTEKTYPGLGMGLYICADIIKRHQGKLWVESAKGKGSTFSFRIPLDTQV